MPAEKGSVTPSAAAAATAASAALPPARRTCRPAREASRSTVETAPPRPTATGVLVAGAAASRTWPPVAAGAGGAGAALTARAVATAPAVATTLHRWRYHDIGVPLSPGRPRPRATVEGTVEQESARNGRERGEAEGRRRRHAGVPRVEGSRPTGVFGRHGGGG